MKKLLLPAIATLAALAVLLKLGFWQLDRLTWKESLIAQVETGVSKAPTPAPAPADWHSLGDDADYRHVRLSGEYLSGAVFYYQALTTPVGTYGGPGTMVYSPFRTTDGWTILINRGFLPQDLGEADRNSALEVPVGQRTITGLLRHSEKPNWTTPGADQVSRMWFARDTADMARVLGLDPEATAPYSVDLDRAYTPDSGLPQAGETIVRFKNDHLGYALTWFGLAATLVGVFLAYAVSILRRR